MEKLDFDKKVSWIEGEKNYTWEKTFKASINNAEIETNTTVIKISTFFPRSIIKLRDYYINYWHEKEQKTKNCEGRQADYMN